MKGEMWRSALEGKIIMVGVDLLKMADNCSRKPVIIYDYNDCNHHHQHLQHLHHVDCDDEHEHEHEYDDED